MVNFVRLNIPLEVRITTVEEVNIQINGCQRVQGVHLLLMHSTGNTPSEGG